MKKLTLLFFALAISFGLGFAFNGYLKEKKSEEKGFKKVTGIGGIFFKCKDPAKLREWYQVNLGLETNPYGCVFEWWQGADSTRKGFTQWSPFNEKTKYFLPSEKDFMVNFRVDNMDKLLVELKKNSVTILDTVAVYDYGKFVHILDNEGNKIELWEANDVAYEKMGNDMKLKTTK